MKKLFVATLLCLCAQYLFGQTIPYTQVPLFSVNYFKKSVSANVPLVEKRRYQKPVTGFVADNEDRLADSIRAERKKNRQMHRAARRAKKA